MQIARIEEYSSVEGPGQRTAVWLQGCSIGCQQCCNPEMLSANAGISLAPAQLAQIIIKAAANGLTLLGGEPLDQACELVEMLEYLRQNNYAGIILFSGYAWQQINADRHRRKAAALCDLVIAGPFEPASTPSYRRWIGSNNQTLHFISDFYAELATNWPKFVKEIEIVIGDDELLVSGTPLSVSDRLANLLPNPGEKHEKIYY